MDMEASETAEAGPTDLPPEEDTAGPPGITVRGAPEAAPAGASLELALEVRDDGGRPLAGTEVRVRVVRGGGRAEADRVTTDPAGIAVVRWRLGPVPVPQRLGIAADTWTAVVAVEALPGDPPADPAPFGDLDAFLQQAGIEGSTEDLAFDPGGDRLVLGVPGGLVAMDPRGDASTMALSGDALGWPLGLAFDHDGTLWAADADGKALRRIDPTGQVTTVAGGPEQVPLAYPNDLAILPDGAIALADTCLGRLLVFERNGTLRSEVPFAAAQEGGPNGVAVDPRLDALWVTTENASLLCQDGTDPLAPVGGLFRFELRQDGTLGDRTTIAPAVAHFLDGLTFDREGNLYVLGDRMPEGALGLEASAIWVRPAQGGDLREFARTTDRVLANPAFGAGEFGEDTLYLSLLAMPLVVDPSARGVQRIGTGIPGGPQAWRRPRFDRGLVAPLDAIPCTDDQGQPTTRCNHHGSSVAVAPDGTVLVVWYTGRGEYSPDSRIVWSRRPPGGDFGPWEILFDEEGAPEGNPVIALGDDPSEWWLFFVTVQGTSWNDGVLRMIRSADQGRTWSEPVTLRSDRNWMFRNPPVRLWNGETLVPCYNETLFVPTFLASRDGFRQDVRQWDLPAETLLLHVGTIQPSVIQRDDGSLWALMRNGNGPFPGHALEMTSTDQGRTWTDPTASPLPNPGGSLVAIRLQDGVVAAAFDNSPDRRRPEAIALSDDEGRSWSAVANLIPDCEGGDCGYPSLAEDPTDGSLWMTWTHARRTIGWAHVDPAWVRLNASGTPGDRR
ncbi:MAG TPA: exo-alpha-sialidase [Myxococcota bacterium]|nr:exo-alpha-sialidase [Myxococcota bacterium]HQK49908.1 exo-alpha-sialidase [Myxococcota bacterium]